MGVTKYRDVSEMPRPDERSTVPLIDRIRSVQQRARTLSPPRVRRGVQKFRNMEEANQAQRAAVATEP